jgi:voltage-gated potassium channel
VLALYAFAVFNYLVATLLSFFIERDAADDQEELVGARSVQRTAQTSSGFASGSRTLLERSERQATFDAK